MKFDFEEMRKTFGDPLSGDQAKMLLKNMSEGMLKASEYHTQMVRNSVEAMKKMQEFWLQSIDWYIDSHQKMTSFVNEQMTSQEKKK